MSRQQPLWMSLLNSKIKMSSSFRGRLTIEEERIQSLHLTPHDTDFGKSLLRAAHESFMTHEAEDWLAFQVATTYGLDKKSMADRLEWTRDNFTLISAVANDPIGNSIYLGEC